MWSARAAFVWNMVLLTILQRHKELTIDCDLPWSYEWPEISKDLTLLNVSFMAWTHPLTLKSWMKASRCRRVLILLASISWPYQCLGDIRSVFIGWVILQNTSLWGMGGFRRTCLVWANWSAALFLHSYVHISVFYF